MIASTYKNSNQHNELTAIPKASYWSMENTDTAFCSLPHVSNKTAYGKEAFLPISENQLLALYYISIRR